MEFVEREEVLIIRNSLENVTESYDPSQVVAQVCC